MVNFTFYILGQIHGQAFFTLTNPQTRKTLGWGSSGVFAAPFDPYWAWQRITQENPAANSRATIILSAPNGEGKLYLTCYNNVLGYQLAAPTGKPLYYYGGFTYTFHGSGLFNMRCGGPWGSLCLTTRTSTPSLTSCSATDGFQRWKLESQYYS